MNNVSQICLFLAVLITACGHSNELGGVSTKMPSPDALRQFVRNYLADVWDKHDFEAAKAKYWHPDIFNANAPDIPHGPEGMMAQVNPFIEAFPDARIEFEDAIAEGNVVAARIWLCGTQQKAFAGIQPTGKSIRIREYVFLEMKDGKILKMYPLVDIAALKEQLAQQ